MTQRKTDDHDAVAQRLDDVEKVQEVLQRAAQEAIAEHARTGHKIVVWRDNQVVWEDPNPTSAQS